MRKVALLLASLGIMTAAYAEQPKLEVTHVGQEFYIENQSGNYDLDEVSLFTNVGLKYGDNWTFGLQAGKQWAVNYGDDHDIVSSNAQSADRYQLDAWRKINDDLKLGFRFRGTDGYDRWYARWDWKHGMLWSAGDIWYQAENEKGDKAAHDSLQFEVFPIGVQYGPVKVGYFVNYVKQMGDVKDTEKEDYWEHQVRAYATLYKGEKLTVTTQARITFAAEENYKGTAVSTFRTYDDFGGRNRIYLGANYKYTDNLALYFDYGYEFRDWKYENGTEASYLAPSDKHSQENYQEITIGWKYTF